MTAPEASAYWEARAERFAADGLGLAAVCSYGMPGFYNTAIHLTQRAALAPWLRVSAGTPVLDVGCGVGRWSRLLARRGARVTGVDLSATMLREARRRAEAEGLGERCQFRQADLAELTLGERFPFVLGVTVLQHIVEPARLRSALQRLVEHLEPEGRLVLLEAAPTRPTARCDGAAFRARSAREYLEVFAGVGLRLQAVGGVDPTPLKPLLLPHYARLPRPLALTALGLGSALALPVDLLVGRAAPGASWHKVFVLVHVELRR